MIRDQSDPLSPDEIEMLGDQDLGAGPKRPKTAPRPRFRSTSTAAEMNPAAITAIIRIVFLLHVSKSPLGPV